MNQIKLKKAHDFVQTVPKRLELFLICAAFIQVKASFVPVFGKRQKGDRRSYVEFMEKISLSLQSLLEFSGP